MDTIVKFILCSLCLQMLFLDLNVGAKGGQSEDSRANILFIVGIPSHSHRVAMEPLAHKLVARGHNISFLTPIKAVKPNPKFKEMSTELWDKFHRDVSVNIGDEYFVARLKSKYNHLIPEPLMMGHLTADASDILFNSPEFKPWVESSSFDVVILENCLSRYGHDIAYKFNASVILFGTSGFWGHDEETFGIPPENSWLSNNFLTNVFTDDLTLYDKVYSTLYPLYHKLVTEWVIIPRMDKVARRVLELPNMPSIAELEMETSMILTNQHFSNDYARSLPPFIAQVAGMHCQESNGVLPKEMEEFIAGAGDEGFIYISFGTIINMSIAPDFIVEIFFNAIRTLKLRFLWKWDVEPSKKLPSNIYAAKWFPQQDVLAHRKIRGFISHGGQMSTQQGVFHAVPMIIIPVLGDQPYNARAISHHKLGIHLELSDLSSTVLTEAITKLIEDSTYAENVKKASKLFRDRPMSAVDTAVYWTEYVLRHKNTSHLKPLAMYQTWWQKRLLDVWFLLFSLSLILVFIVCKIAALSCRFIRRSTKIKIN